MTEEVHDSMMLCQTPNMLWHMLQDPTRGGPATFRDPARGHTQLRLGSPVWAPPHLPVFASPAHSLVRLWLSHQEHHSRSEGMSPPPECTSTAVCSASGLYHLLQSAVSVLCEFGVMLRYSQVRRLGGQENSVASIGGTVYTSANASATYCTHLKG